MKKLLLLTVMSVGIINAMEDNKPDLQTFRSHILEAESVRNSISNHIFGDSVTAQMRKKDFADIILAMNQLHKDMRLAETLLMPKIQDEMRRCIFQLEFLKNAVLSSHRHSPGNKTQTPPLEPLNL